MKQEQILLMIQLLRNNTELEKGEKQKRLQELINKLKVVVD